MIKYRLIQWKQLNRSNTKVLQIIQLLTQSVQIADIITEVLNLAPTVAVESLDGVLQADAQARQLAEQWLQRHGR